MSQTPRNHMEIRNLFTDKVEYLPSFTCHRCGRGTILNPKRTRPRDACRQHNELVCKFCRGSECHTFERDAEKALLDRWGQPWLLRGLRADGRDANEPVARIWDEQDRPQLVLRKDLNITDRELEAMWDGVSKRDLERRMKALRATS